MPHFGIFCPPVPGHLNPFYALGRALQKRGHRATIFHVEDLGPAVEAEGLSFVALRDEAFPPGTVRAMTARLAAQEGLKSLKFAIECSCKVSGLILERGPAAVTTAGVDVLLVDQNEPAGASVAERLDVPFVSVCTSLPMNREASIPPPFVGWPHAESFLTRLRNRIGYAVSDRFIAPIQATLNRYRKDWGLAPLTCPDDSFSKLAQIAQMPAEFDFPRESMTPVFHYCGPFFDDFGAKTVAFPFERLDGRPLIYASLGTLQQKDHRFFHVIAEACSNLDAQLVLSGAQAGANLLKLSSNSIVVPYAPQTELLSRASATITHAGMNTTQQSLYFGVPLVAIPLTHDQPAIAARLARTGAGIVIPKQKLNAEVLRAAVQSVLSAGNPCKVNALRMQRASRNAGGLERAMAIAESLVDARFVR